ncbi:peptidylprolyl isomerase [Helicobacter monodelphidis]|uniref:peptidylprolyl isomerase n=1 Tax=Helicobacter sp. 15-1451 TaxID=2004995 RepID=UPI0015EC11BE|nr:peptidylprolyl isomerase [Helicobacter sp. 15-1451]
MRLFLLNLCLCCGLSAANFVNGIAFFVNNEPVTLFQLYQVMQGAKVSREEAMELLISEKLHEEEAKKFNIQITEIEIDEELQRIAQRSNQSVDQLKSIILARGVAYSHYRDEVKKRVLQKKLYSMIVTENIELADESELKSYYDQHHNDFIVPTHISIVRYSASSQPLLEQLVNAKRSISSIPVAPDGVLSAPEVVETAKLNPQLTALLMNVNVGSFTPIFNIGGEYATFLVSSKSGGVQIPFEEAKRDIFARIMMERENTVIKGYFDKLRAVAKIKVLRLE